MAKIKDKQRVLKAVKERKKMIYKGNPIRLSGDYLTQTLQASREWHDVLNVLKQKDLQPRILYLATLSFKFEAGIKQFPHKQKLKEYTTTRPALEGMLKTML